MAEIEQDVSVRVAPAISKTKRERSPAFPFIPLSAAVKRLVEFEDYFKRHPAPAKQAGLAWGMKGWTSQAQQTLAALKSFGFIDYSGSGDNLQAAISEDGRTYLRAQQDTIKQDILKRSALKPKNLAKYFNLWGADRPRDPVCLDQLVLKDGFTEPSAKTFLQVYDATIEYAGLVESDKAFVVGTEDLDEERSDARTRARVGDHIHWLSAGQEMFKIARRVEWISDDGSYLRVHGSSTGIPVNEVTVVEKPNIEPPAARTPLSSSAYAGSDGQLSVLLTGGRLQITADVDLAGVERLKEVLGKYEEILKLLAS